MGKKSDKFLQECDLPIPKLGDMRGSVPILADFLCLIYKHI